jgi:hypothetical protein
MAYSLARAGDRPGHGACHLTDSLGRVRLVRFSQMWEICSLSSGMASHFGRRSRVGHFFLHDITEGETEEEHKQSPREINAFW